LIREQGPWWALPIMSKLSSWLGFKPQAS